MDWRIYYVDGSKFSSTDGWWEDAPLFGVFAVVERCESTGRRVLYGTDYYYRPPTDAWLEAMSCEWDGDYTAKTDNLTPTLQKYAPWIKWGMWTSNLKKDEILGLAMSDPDFPPISATDPVIDQPKGV